MDPAVIFKLNENLESYFLAKYSNNCDNMLSNNYNKVDLARVSTLHISVALRMVHICPIMVTSNCDRSCLQLLIRL